MVFPSADIIRAIFIAQIHHRLRDILLDRWPRICHRYVTDGVGGVPPLVWANALVSASHVTDYIVTTFSVLWHWPWLWLWL